MPELPKNCGLVVQYWQIRQHDLCLKGTLPNTRRAQAPRACLRDAMDAMIRCMQTSATCTTSAMSLMSKLPKACLIFWMPLINADNIGSCTITTSRIDASTQVVRYCMHVCMMHVFTCKNSPSMPNAPACGHTQVLMFRKSVRLAEYEQERKRIHISFYKKYSAGY
jgi:hypothetical protein